MPAEIHPSPIVVVAAAGALDDTVLGFAVGLTEDFIVGDLVVGFAVGARVGIRDGTGTTGFADGTIEDFFEGVVDGLIEDFAVGTRVGGRDGAGATGFAVGLTVVFAVGATERVAEVGLTVVRKLGLKVGAAVGPQFPKLLSFLGTCRSRLTHVPKLLGTIFWILFFAASQRSAFVTMSGAVVKETWFFCSSSARAPATCGVAIDVPEYCTYEDVPVQVAHAELIALPGAIISTHGPVLE